jgi:hypothetical protein
MPRYLTKSRFKIALECASKLYYTRKEHLYPNQKSIDRFLLELAKGGIQVGELAKFYHGVDPIINSITITAKPNEYELALTDTNRMLDQEGRVVIAEAAFLYNNCFIRADIIVKDSEYIELYEVKATSWSEGETLSKASGGPNGEWHEYLYDVAFQKWIIQKATGIPVKAFLTVVNKDAVASVTGLGRHFKVFKKGAETVVEITHGLTKEALGNSLLINLPVDDICSWIFANPVDTGLSEKFTFEQFISFASEKYELDQRISVPITSSCKKCEFYATANQLESGLKSGIQECWIDGGYVSKGDYLTESLIFELWGGNAGNANPTQKLIDNKIFLLRNGQRSLFDSKQENGVDGFSNHERREIQINKARDRDATPRIAKDALERRIQSWDYPLHFIDFETSMVPLPWYAGRRPYEGVAFQFSHHVFEMDDRIEHRSQYISFEPGVFPNFEFVRKLKEALQDKGTIFRYHHHENTYLRLIHRQLQQTSNDIAPDRQELIDFIDSITQWKETVGKKTITNAGIRNMVDLYDVVLKCYYSPHAKGSNSLKQILPAIINDFPGVREKYSKEIYGKELPIKSLNYDRKVWITIESGLDPYKTLEPIFPQYSQSELDRLVADMEGLADGGTAMMAFNMLQISEIPLEQRTLIRDALLRYCELDTLAMVMLYEGLREACGLSK